jgi:hypothetical protein
MDMDYGRLFGHPLDPRTAQAPDYAVSQATDHAGGIPAHWLTFLAASITKYDSGDVETFRIQQEDIRECDTATLLVLALVGTNDQANAARMLLQDEFAEHHSELINELATQCDDAHCDGPDEWEAA